MTLYEKANHVVQRLTGCCLNTFGRAANLFWFTFGNITLHASASNSSKPIIEYALHIQCRWRIRRGTQILIGYRDLLYPKEYPDDSKVKDFDWDVIGSSRFDMLCEQLQDDFSQLNVESAGANELGELAIHFEKGYILETFIDDSLESENWRFFPRGRSDLHHWVQEGSRLSGD